jgi:hypothetical protein
MKTMKKEYLLTIRNLTFVFKNKEDLKFFSFILDDTIKANPAPDEKSPECWRATIAEMIANKFHITLLNV